MEIVFFTIKVIFSLILCVLFLYYAIIIYATIRAKKHSKVPIPRTWIIITVINCLFILLSIGIILITNIL